MHNFQSRRGSSLSERANVRSSVPKGQYLQRVFANVESNR